VKLNIGGSVHDPNDPIGRLLFNVLATIAEFESDLIRMRTREGMKVAKAKGRLRGKAPKLSATQETHLVELYRAGTHHCRAGRTVHRRTVHRLPRRPARRRRQSRLITSFAAATLRLVTAPLPTPLDPLGADAERGQAVALGGEVLPDRRHRA